MKNKFPEGWDEKKIQEVINHYENQSEDDAVAEDEKGFEKENETFISVPKALLPEIRKLIADYDLLTETK